MKSPYKTLKINGHHMDEHRYLMQQHVGRQLDRFELVHHKDHNKRNNSIDNLEIVTPKEHALIHLQKHPLTWVCEHCGKEFTPHPTKRGGIKKTCSKKCRYARLSKISRDPSKPKSMYRADAYPSEVSSRGIHASE